MHLGNGGDMVAAYQVVPSLQTQLVAAIGTLDFHTAREMTMYTPEQVWAKEPLEGSLSIDVIEDLTTQALDEIAAS